MILLPVSHHKQHKESDCLVACAAMVFSYLQLPFRYEQLQRILRTEQHGTVFSNLQNLESLGVYVFLGNGSIEVLQNHLETGLPAIVAVETEYLSSYWHDATRHALVVIGIEEDMLYLNDPAFDTAPKAVSRNEFEPAWIEQNYRYAVIGLDQF